MAINPQTRCSKQLRKKHPSRSSLRDLNKRYGRTIRFHSERKLAARLQPRPAVGAASSHHGDHFANPVIRNRIIFWSIVILIALVLGALSHVVSLKTVHAWGEAINGWLLFLLILLLPLVGMPMSICGILIGAKFGVCDGIIVTAVAVAFQLSASWGIARTWLHKPIEKILRKTRYQMPSLETGEYAAVCLLTALIPGPSYTLKNYFLALSNLPFGIVLGVGLPANLFAMLPGVLFGSFTAAMNWPKAIFLIVYVVLLFVASHWVIRIIRARAGRRVRPTVA
jgi:uncharacterized membrane protein YdjX (TVP38/TMEM64 family)